MFSTEFLRNWNVHDFDESLCRRRRQWRKKKTTYYLSTVVAHTVLGYNFPNNTSILSASDIKYCSHMVDADLVCVSNEETPPYRSITPLGTTQLDLLAGEKVDNSPPCTPGACQSHKVNMKYLFSLRSTQRIYRARTQQFSRRLCIST